MCKCVDKKNNNKNKNKKTKTLSLTTLEKTFLEKIKLAKSNHKVKVNVLYSLANNKITELQWNLLKADIL